MSMFRKSLFFSLATLLSLTAADPGRAEGRPAAPPIEAYGRLPVLTDVSLSPSGDRLALVRHQGDQNRVVIQDLSGNLLLLVEAHAEKIRNIEWVSDRFIFLHSTVPKTIRSIWIDRNSIYCDRSMSINEKISNYC